MTAERFDGSVLEPWIQVRFDRAGGPGGQNVNKVSTRATLLFDFQACTLLTEEEKARVRAQLASRLARDGRLRIVAQRHRTQPANRLAAERRLCELLAAALTVPRARRATRPTAGGRERRLTAKHRRSQTKQLRQSRPGADP